MWRVKLSIILLMSACLAGVLPAQTSEPVFRFLGTDSAEEIDPYDVERIEEYLEHPLKLNHVSQSGLRESGLLSHYQAASLADYRSRHGDVLSFSELAAVDGFGHDFVAGLKPFVSLESNRPPCASFSPFVRNDIAVRASVRSGNILAYGLKYRLTAGERWTGGLSVSRTFSAGSMAPDAYSGHIAFHFKSRPGKLIAGDFNARFGQGLALWNGLSFSGLTSASSFMRKPSGISASSSFTGGYAFRGAAVEIGFGPMVATVLTSVSKSREALSVMPAANVAWLMVNGQISLTHYADFSAGGPSVRIPDMKTSFDAAFCLKGADIYGEAAYDWVSSSLAALAGLTFPAGENVRLSSMLRYYPSGFSPSKSAAARSTTKCTNEYAASMAADFSAGGWVAVNGASGFGSSVRRHSGKASADFACFPVPKASDAVMKSIQVKLQTEWTWMISGAFRTKFRLSERVRTWDDPFRTDFRADFSYLSEHFMFNLRLNALSCRGIGLLTYSEGAYKSEKVAFYLRAGLFRIDNWADRIYVHERDAPGSFNVPAYYGRGLWTAMAMNWRFARWGRMYLRGALTAYPFMAEKKPGRAELKLHLVFTLRES